MQNIISIGQLGSQPLSIAKAQQGGAGLSFSQLLDDSLRQLEQAQALSRQDAYDLALGRAEDLHSIAMRSAQGTAALELTVGLTTRAMSAYKEILQMQI